ncbi:MAG: pyrroline-5-carboxylate reductase [Burkholderiaceae bacterium]
MNGDSRIAFIGGGNMASALVGGLIQKGRRPDHLLAVEIDPARREALARDFGIEVAPAPDARLARFDVIVLAVKPQQMKEVCAALRPFVGQQLALSIAAGIRIVDLARWLGTDRIVRAMPNTPALIGRGIAGLAAQPAVTASQRDQATQILQAVGGVVWFEDEAQLDAVTAISGSGPAYVFYFIEALIDAGRAMGLSDEQSRRLAIETLVGASHLAAESGEPPEVLRARVTSKGGTTAAAIESMDADRIKAKIVAAVRAAQRRAAELGDEFGK